MTPLARDAAIRLDPHLPLSAFNQLREAGPLQAGLERARTVFEGIRDIVAD